MLLVTLLIYLYSKSTMAGCLAVQVGLLFNITGITCGIASGQ